MDYKAYLNDIQANLESGKMQWRRGDKILNAFGYARRRQTFVDLANSELEKRGLVAVPKITTDLDLGGYTRFLLRASEGMETTVPEAPSPEEPEIEIIEPPPDEIEAVEKAELEELPNVDLSNPADFALTVSNLECSERAPVCIKPQETVAAALTIMQLNDFSQLVVASSPREIKGIISYKSIARAQLHGRPEKVSECLDETVPRVKLSEPLMRVIASFRRHDAVLVLSADQTISGIVTPADIAVEFSSLASPFLVIGEIEQHLRWLIRKVDVDDALTLTAGPEEAVVSHAEPSELTMGELQRIIQNPNVWGVTGVNYDRALFCAELDAIRKARNALMHFKEPLEDGMVERLQNFADLLRTACAQLARNPNDTASN